MKTLIQFAILWTALTMTAEARILVVFERTLSWTTHYSRVIINGKTVEPIDFRGPTFSGFFGNDEHFNIGTLTQGKERCELRIPYFVANGKVITLEDKGILFRNGSMMEWMQDIPLDANDSDFDHKGLFLATGFEMNPHTESTPTRIFVPIRCKGSGSLEDLLEKHFKNLASFTR